MPTFAIDTNDVQLTAVFACTRYVGPVCTVGFCAKLSWTIVVVRHDGQCCVQL